MLYYFGNLFLCIERAVAVVRVSQYERYVSPFITASIIFCVLSASAATGTVLNALVAKYSNIPLLVFVVLYSVLCFSIAISVCVYRKTSKKMSLSYSLRKKYQDKENGRTAAVYTCISLNELLCSVATVGAYTLLVSAHANMNQPMAIAFDNALELIDSYRILFINVTILLNCFLWSRRQNKVFIEKQGDHGDQYFLQLQNSWEAARQNSTGQAKS
ncbi:hypothetical protein ANCCAN_05900 [Ancylostoma caninum]|uniref:Uncharacterized protein n=1 Tax=Ancylostoma caninum TaxID=29170 RepID=A0A368GUT3_ANCCA|nr:hypothetical protein ANCCAN_05900 [Ancylostoma caninum]